MISKSSRNAFPKKRKIPALINARILSFLIYMIGSLWKIWLPKQTVIPTTSPNYSDYSYIEIATYLGFSSQSHLGTHLKNTPDTLCGNTGKSTDEGNDHFTFVSRMIFRTGSTKDGDTESSSIPIFRKVSVNVVSAPSSPQMPTQQPPL